ncbi:tRNA dihydrouridine synthase DusB [Thalassobaculum sp. OXR-137]|nr:tRNA dihydrouridine synthase DusB [Thalassobaculum sp. OXR-137]WPZ37097.1 tRNA dihydrouridine synthase DusB [Thalassobaculum sp. OXR-137]
MSGVTDRPFRRLARRLGAPLVVTEMIASHAVLRDVLEETRKAEIDSEDTPAVVQIAGWEPEIMAEAARMMADRGADAIDINMGCPAKKVVNKYAGSALMRDELLAGRIMEAVVAAVDLPVTLKMRLGWDAENRNAPELARIAEAAGIRLITVHGRTRCQMYTGTADWSGIRAVVETVSLPVVANGDVTSIETARACLEESGADGVMIGRGCYGRPWFPAQVAAALAGETPRADPDVQERRAILAEHLDAMLSHYGVQSGIRNARKHIGWYTDGLAGSAGFRQRVNNTTDPAVVFAEIDRYFAELDAGATGNDDNGGRIAA